MRLNQCTLVGRLLADPTMAPAAGDTQARCAFRIAINRIKSEKYDVVPIVAWGKLAEACANHLAKGKEVCVTGEYRSNAVKADDGTYANYHEIRAERVNFGADSVKSQRAKGQSIDAVAEALATSVKKPAAKAAPTQLEKLTDALIKKGLSKTLAAKTAKDFLVKKAAEAAPAAPAEAAAEATASDADVPF
jgi:single-strand DNA-binding protein